MPRTHTTSTLATWIDTGIKPSETFDRCIVVDCDGTLWRGDLGDSVFALAAQRGLFKGEALTAFESFWRRHQLPLPSYSSKILRSDADTVNIFSISLLEHLNSEALSFSNSTPDRQLQAELFTLQAQCFAGMLVEEVQALAAHVYEEVLKPQLISSVLNIVRAAQKEDVPVLAISASGHLLIQEALKKLDIAEFSGIQCTQQHGRCTTQVIQPIPYGVGKVHALADLGVQRPVLVIADNPHGTDRELFECAVRGLVVGTDPHRQHQHCERLAGT